MRVAILMGSDSDLPIMEKAADILDEFGVAYELRVASAHRTPDAVREYVRSAADRGIACLIAAAGGAAHLAGAVAAQTTLPVIGVPIAGAGGTLGGLDALLSTVNMPEGVPVATVAINGAANAALLAVSILATGDGELRGKLVAYREGLAARVAVKDSRLQAKLQAGKGGMASS